MLEMGKVYEGKVKGITNYGAFVEVPQEEGNPVTGMVHISEVANVFVNDIHDFLTEGQEVKVVVLQVNEQGKIAMSIRKAMPKEERRPQKNYPSRQRRERGTVWEGSKVQK
ncbi:MAG: S1 RNA-binding domain-containing protein, partial [Oscillospiraceae bacterium]|nr:S1 RNA-binding domain-containing protein [Oscillospiraceae bacterium]